MATNKPLPFDPIKSLPLPMQKYVGMPGKALRICIGLNVLFAAGVYFGSTQMGHADGPSTPAKTYGLGNVAQKEAAASAEDGDTVLADIKVSGRQDFKIKVKRKGTRLYLSDGTALKLEATDKDLRLTLGGQGTQYRLKEKEGKANLYGSSEGAVMKLERRDDGQMVISLTDGSAKYRIKIKDGSFNIYDKSDARILKGKLKDGHVNVKPEGSDQRALKISGERVLIRAAMLALPIEPPYSTLLWRHLGK